MPRYKLRTLLILLAVGPPWVAWFWFAHQIPLGSRLFIGFQEVRKPFEVSIESAAPIVAAGLLAFVVVVAMEFNRWRDKRAKTDNPNGIT